MSTSLGIGAGYAAAQVYAGAAASQVAAHAQAVGPPKPSAPSSGGETARPVEPSNSASGGGASGQRGGANAEALFTASAGEPTRGQGGEEAGLDAQSQQAMQRQLEAALSHVRNSPLG